MSEEYGFRNRHDRQHEPAALAGIEPGAWRCRCGDEGSWEGCSEHLFNNHPDYHHSWQWDALYSAATVERLVQERDNIIAQQAELLAAHKAEMQDWQRALLSAQQESAEYRAALEKLACLGNGDTYGNSIGNCIAQDALAKHSPEDEIERARRLTG